ncbi:MAG: thiolase family protein [Anaerolineae bacterium]|nr:thiolase family protein [Anaerolineae bacterium]
MKEAVIVSTARTAIGKAPRGALRTTRPDDMAAAVIGALLERTPALDPAQLDDVAMGCAFPEGEQGMNVGRVAALRAGLPDSVPAYTLNRFCASGLQTIASAAQSIMAGFTRAAIAGGVESMSLVPMTGNKFAPNPALVREHPGVYLSMGLTAENVARAFNVSREDQDAFAYRSHMRAAAAQDAGRLSDGIVPLEVRRTCVDDAGALHTEATVFAQDEGIRRDTSLEALAKLKPVFAQGGTVTAGNASQTSDGAAAVLLMERAWAESLGLKPLARFVSYAVGGVPPEIMGMGPVAAVPRALDIAGLSLADIDLIELNEAFAAQALAVMRELGLEEAKTNVNGGAIALGHPLGCTGAKLTVQMVGELKRRNGRYGLVTMCIGGGMGAAGVFENLD